MDSNNNNNNKEFEKLFYNVFHNKYIFNLIIHHIQSTEWIIYQNINDYNSNNRRRFKDIISLEFMIEKKLFSLLELKLKANEYILLDSSLEWINQLENKIEIFHYFLNNSSIMNYDYVMDNLILLDQDLIEIAINEPYSIEISLSNFKEMFFINFFKNLNEFEDRKQKEYEKLEYLFQIFFKNLIKRDKEDHLSESINQLIEMVSNRVKCIFQRDIVYGLIFNSIEKLKLSSTPTIQIPTTTTKTTTISNNHFMEIVYRTNSNLIQNQLMDFFKIDKSNLIYPYSEEFKIIDWGYRNLLKSVENFESYLSNNPNDIKGIQKRITTILGSIKIENNMHDRYAIGSDTVRYYLNLNNQPIDYHYFKNEEIDNLIIKKLNLELKLNEYQDIQEMVSDSISTNNISFIYNEILNSSIQTPDYIIINQNNIIDLLLKVNKYNKCSGVFLETNEHEDYYISKGGKCDIRKWSYSNDLFKINSDESIRICNQKNGPNNDIYYFYKSNENHIIQDNSILISLISKIIERFIPHRMDIIYYCIDLIKSPSPSSPTNLSLFKNIKINNKSPPNISKWISIYKHLIDNAYWGQLESLLNVFNPIVEYPELINDGLLDTRVDIDKIFLDEFYIDQPLSSDMVSCMELTINNFNDYKNQNQNSSSTDSIHLAFENVIKYLYFKLIINPKITVEQFMHIYNFIKNNSNHQIDLPFSEEYSIYYLSLLSPKIKKFFRKRVSNIPIFFNAKNLKIDDLFRKYFEFYSFEYIFKKYFLNYQYLNINMVIDELVSQLFFTIIKDTSNNIPLDNLNKFINQRLFYFIEIKRQDLLLESIKLLKSLPYFNQLVFDIPLKNVSLCHYNSELLLIVNQNQSKQLEKYKEYDQILESNANEKQCNNNYCDFNVSLYDKPSEFYKYHSFYFSKENLQLDEILKEHKVTLNTSILNQPMDFILLCFKNYFPITSKIIDLALENNKINLLKYLYKNGLINNQELEFLKLKLSKHEYYKFNNWF